MNQVERYDIHYLIRRLIDLEAPNASKDEREQMTEDWLAHDYEYIVDTWAHCHRKLRKGQVA